MLNSDQWDYFVSLIMNAWIFAVLCFLFIAVLVGIIKYVESLFEFFDRCLLKTHDDFIKY